MAILPIKRTLINAAATVGIVLVSAIPTYASSHTLIFDESIYDADSFTLDHNQCYDMLEGVGQHEVAGALEQGVKRGLRGATAGAIAGSVSGNSGSSAAKTGAAIGTTVGVLSGAGSKASADKINQDERNSLMRNCMKGRGYDALN